MLEFAATPALRDYQGEKRASLAAKGLTSYNTSAVTYKPECRALYLSQSLPRRTTLHAAHPGGLGVGKAPVAEMFVTLHKIIGEESARLWQRKG